MRDRSALTMTTWVSRSPEHAAIHASRLHVHAHIWNSRLDQSTVDNVPHCVTENPPWRNANSTFHYNNTNNCLTASVASG
jgi:hypothetical protein